MQNDLLLWIVAGAVCLLLGKEIGKWLPSLPSFKTSVADRRKAAAEKLAARLKAAGQQMVQDAKDSIARIQEVAEMVKDGNAAILKDLDDVYAKIKAQAPSQPAAPASSPVAPASGPAQQ
jgi:hypothetical protein